jgi:very-short-patch-repair endonuclease
VEELPGELLVGPFTLDRARELGVGRQVLRSRRFRAPFTGVRVPSELPDTITLRCAAAQLVIPEEATFSHETAAELMELWMPHSYRAGPLHVTVPLGCVVPHRPGIVGHQRNRPDGDIRIQGRLPATSGPRTLCDLAGAGWGLTDLVVIADSLQKQGLADLAELRARTAACRGERGVRILRATLALTRPGSESAMETRLRLLLRAANLPEPAVNQVVRDANGEYVHRPDLSWPDHKVAADYDGAHHLTDVERRRRLDIGRKEALEEEGWLLRVLTASDVLNHPDRAAERIRRALRERGARV